MTDYHDKGFAVVDLMDPRFAAGLWRDIDQDAIRKLLEKAHEKHWQPLSFPRTPSFLNFNQELENRMYKCWERYGKKFAKPKIVKQDLMLFVRSQDRIAFSGAEEHVLVLVPLIMVSQHNGLPTLMEGSHRRSNQGPNGKPYDFVVHPGHALMHDARLTAHIPSTAGGVLVATIYDMTGM